MYSNVTYKDVFVMYVVEVRVARCRVLLTVVALLSSYSIHLLLKCSGIVGTCLHLLISKPLNYTRDKKHVHNTT